jgi:hypothetical protein
MIRWQHYEVEEFFGAEAKYDDGPHSYEFAVSRNGVRLLMTLFDLEGAVYASIFRDGLPEPLVTVVRESCTHALVSSDTRGRRCLAVGSPDAPVTEMGIPPVLIRGLRIFLEPQIQLEFIDHEPRGTE